MREPLSPKTAPDALPLMRVYICGELLLERLIIEPGAGERIPVYEAVAAGSWNSRGPALTLLKVLLCSPGRRASKDALIEAIWPGDKGESINADRALQAAASVLRSVLQTTKGESLLITTTGSDGSSYRLATEPELWVDVDAFEACLQRAIKAKNTDDALIAWEAAYQLAQGVFLSNDLFSEWSQVRRRRLEGNRRLCIHRLAELYSERGRNDEAEVVLRSYWVENLADEDVLRRLMALLAQQGREEEAMHLYQQTEQALLEDDLQPTARTKALAESLHQQPSPLLQLIPTRTVATAQASYYGAMPFSAVPPLYNARTIAQESGWLTLGASYLGQLFDDGWSVNAISDSLKIVLPAIEAMPVFARQKLLDMGTMNDMLSIAGQHVSIEDQNSISQVLGESIATGWRLFHTVGNKEVFTVGQTLLHLVRQNHALLYPHVRSLLYSGVYRLIGAALYFQSRFEEAHHMQECAYLAALENADAWNMAQSRTWQAYGYRSLDRYKEAIVCVEAALRLITGQNDEAHRRLRSHLFALWAELATVMHEWKLAQEKLTLSSQLLEGVGPNEEFDETHWIHIAGRCALFMNDYPLAIRYLEEALAQLPAHLIMHQAITAMPLATAYARLRKRDASLSAARKAVFSIGSLNAPLINKQLIDYIGHDLEGFFPGDAHVGSFIQDIQQQFPQIGTELKLIM